MTAALATSTAEKTHAQATAAGRGRAKRSVLAELEEMRKAMLREDGLFNAAQSALFLDVSRDRIYELLELGMLTKYEFLGRVYLSYKELCARRAADVKAGRPPRNTVQRLKVGAKTVRHMDAGQLASELYSDAKKLAGKKRTK